MKYQMGKSMDQLSTILTISFKSAGKEKGYIGKKLKDIWRYDYHSKQLLSAILNSSLKSKLI